MSLETIVIVNISKDTKAPSQTGFGIPAILSKEAALLPAFAAVRVKEYAILTVLDDLVADGFTTADETFKAAQSVASQSPRVEKLKVVRQAVSIAQITDFTVDNVVDETTYTTTINGVPYSFLSGVGATDLQITAGLIAAINLGTDPLTAAPGISDEKYKVTSDEAGRGFSQAVDANQSLDVSTSNLGPVEEVISARDESKASDDWYFMFQAPAVTLDTELLASYFEAQIKIFGYQTDDADSKDALQVPDADNLMQLLFDQNYARTFGIWTPTAKLSEYKIADWIGLMAPKNPGSATWKFKEVSTASADEFTSQEKTNISDKNGNTYTEVAGFNIFEEGVTASGEFIDITRGIDWLVARIQENVFGLFAETDKVSYDDDGIGLIGLRIDEIGKLAEKNLVIVKDTFETEVPLRADTTKADRAARSLKNVKFNGDLAGAIHSVEIDGTVTV